MTPPAAKKVIRVDASSLKESACRRRFVLQVYTGLSGDKIAVDMVYGSAFHKVVETYDLTQGDETLAAKAGQDYLTIAFDSGKVLVTDKKKHLNNGHLFHASRKYFHEVKTNPIFLDNKVLTISGDIMVEKKFSLKIYEDEEYIVLAQGTIDKLAEMLKTGVIAISDWKTTGAYDADQYFTQYIMSCQLRFYQCMVKKVAARFPEREFAQKINNGRMIAFVNGAFLSAPLGITFKRSRMFMYGNKDMEAFEVMFMEAVLQLVNDVRTLDKTGVYPMAYGIINGACQTPYGPAEVGGLCKFHKVCSSMVGLDESVDGNRLFKSLLDTSFVKKEYRPLKFGGEGKL